MIGTMQNSVPYGPGFSTEDYWDDGLIEAALEYNGLTDEDFENMGQVEQMEFLSDHAAMLEGDRIDRAMNMCENRFN